MPYLGRLHGLLDHVMLGCHLRAKGCLELELLGLWANVRTDHYHNRCSEQLLTFHSGHTLLPLTKEIYLLSPTDPRGMGTPFH